MGNINYPEVQTGGAPRESKGGYGCSTLLLSFLVGSALGTGITGVFKAYEDRIRGVVDEKASKALDARIKVIEERLGIKIQPEEIEE